jgi:hypothetical protein
MSDDDLQDQTPVYTFLNEEPAEVFRELAGLHHKEAKQLLEHAQQAEAEDRQEEAKLLMDVMAAREQRAAELEKAARGEVEDPSVIEVLDGQQDILSHYTPNTMTFFKEDELPPATVPEHMRPRPPGRIALTMTKISNKISNWMAKISNWWKQ